jgi:inner membrane protein
MLGILILTLWIPLTLVENLIRERQSRQIRAETEIGAVWGNAQTITGPILIVPFRYWAPSSFGDSERLVQHRARLFILPDQLRIASQIDPEVRYRGIFRANVYRAEFNVSGRFVLPRPEQLDLDRAEIDWDKAVVAVGATDLRGVPRAPMLTWNGVTAELAPGTTHDGLLPSGLHAPVRVAPGATQPIEFSFDLALAGSSSLSFTPSAKSSEIRAMSRWAHPAFNGAFLPTERRIDDDGFSAVWHVTNLAFSFPQYWTEAGSAGRTATDSAILRGFQAVRFDVTLASPVNFYQQVERSVKYGLLFVVLLVAALFVFDVMSGFKIHVLQYGLAGLALCLFYLLLLSFAEIVGFAYAYAAAAAMSTALTAWYVGASLASLRGGLAIGGILASTYALLYVILQLEKWALLGGALSLFSSLATLMYVTRKIDLPKLLGDQTASGSRGSGGATAATAGAS